MDEWNASDSCLVFLFLAVPAAILLCQGLHAWH